MSGLSGKLCGKLLSTDKASTKKTQHTIDKLKHTG